ncbi:NfeD family protein [Pelagicoccus sp. SDUM812002]|uniref:NfeD family protein n=1 Tax=Pelagicoccus sp. SDUM812002 TaxID=3041266 RepID=UPI00280DADDA|nr:NfeD family protein [Pelagicoccus sp. SDUM812002]MDQ8186375.1 NfeD family protein [Pelagicoccus sp. SDUM812002]
MSELTLDPAVIWLIAGVVLIVAEFIVPGLVIIFFGLGALIVSLLAYLGWVTELSSQLLIFSALSIVLLFGLRWQFKGWFVGQSAETGGSDELSDLIGKEVTCLTGFSPDRPYGKVEFKGANWKGRCEQELKVGSVAIIESIDGLCLNLKPRD